tara:strand:+ start:848 stop:2107 length:1260 start_codon:yes stop_codon:yes gene_type:complete
MNKVTSIYMLFLLLLIGEIAFAQQTTSSPYSRFGLGDLKSQFSPVFNSLGGGGYAINDSKIINPFSPASYSSFQANSFLFSTGINNETIDIQSFSENQTVNNLSLSHILFGFPLTKKIGSSFGVMPYSSIGYSMNSRDDIFDADMLYEGDGGISKVFFGSSLQLHQNFSVGANTSYLFGGLNRRKKLVFDDETIFNSRSNSLININGIYYEFGAVFSKEISDNNSKISISLNTSNNTDVKVKRTNVVETFSYSGTNEIVKDTFVNSVEKGNVVLPKYTNLGLAYSLDKWLFIFDYSTQNWSDYALFEESDSLINSQRISAGLQYTPDMSSVNQFYKRCHYRVGLALNTTPLQINNTQLEDKSISFGMGIPIKKNKSTYDISLILGQRGTTSNNLLKENYVKIGLSMSFEGIWFVKQKYN